ncbi:MAG: hypothetical protein ACI4XM_02045 [Candidatus Coprovivens sp.]
MQRWNIGYLKDLYHKYYSIACETADPTLSLEYESTANSILDIIDRYDELTHTRRHLLEKGESSNFRCIIEDDFSIIDKYGIYCPYIREISDIGESLIIKPNDKLPTIDTSISKVLTISKDFYSSIGGVFSKKYTLLSSRFKNTLFVNKLSPNIAESGQTYSVYNTDITFIELGVNNTAQDYITAIHEFGHGISCTINPLAMFDFGKYCFIELESLFFEILGVDYLKDKLDLEQDSFDISIQVLKDYIYSAQLICSKLNMYNTLTSRQLYDKRTVKKYLSIEEGYNLIGVKDVINTYMRDYFHYIISYLTAIELYIIYQYDKQFALDLLYKIINSKNEHSAGYLEYVKSLGLEPGKNFEKYLKILFDKARDLKDGKSLRYKN